MRKLVGIVLLFYSFKIFPQTNLVPNPSFETYTACPVGPGEIQKALGWTHNGSSDYFNSCAPYNQSSVPNNWGGYQQAASGNAYAGIATYNSLSSNYREFVSHNLSSSLSIGTKYFVSFKSNLSLGSSANSNCATDKIGAMFSTIQFTGFYQLIKNTAKAYSNVINTDTLGWTKVFGSFVSDSLYDHIILGNFFNDANTNKTVLYSSSSDVSYYFVDDVCVSTDSLFTLNYVYTGINEEKESSVISIYPNPIVSDFFNIESDIGEYSLMIENALGEVLFSEQNVHEKAYKVIVESYESGLLFITIKTKEKTINHKLIKQ